MTPLPSLPRLTFPPTLPPLSPLISPLLLSPFLPILFLPFHQRQSASFTPSPHFILSVLFSVSFVLSRPFILFLSTAYISVYVWFVFFLNPPFINLYFVHIFPIITVNSLSSFSFIHISFHFLVPFLTFPASYSFIFSLPYSFLSPPIPPNLSSIAGYSTTPFLLPSLYPFLPHPFILPAVPLSRHRAHTLKHSTTQQINVTEYPATSGRQRANKEHLKSIST